MEEGIIRAAPNPAGAAIATDIASALLSSARQKLLSGDFIGSMADSRDAMRMASSALLLHDGFIADTMDSATAYLSARYPGRFPISEWQRTETMASGHEYGLYHMILRYLGRTRKTGEKEAESSLSAAERFVRSAAEALK